MLENHVVLVGDVSDGQEEGQFHCQVVVGPESINDVMIIVDVNHRNQGHGHGEKRLKGAAVGSLPVATTEPSHVVLQVKLSHLAQGFLIGFEQSFLQWVALFHPPLKALRVQLDSVRVYLITTTKHNMVVLASVLLQHIEPKRVFEPRCVCRE